MVEDIKSDQFQAQTVQVSMWHGTRYPPWPPCSPCFFVCRPNLSNLSSSPSTDTLLDYVFRSLPILACVAGASAFLTGPASVTGGPPGTARYQQAVSVRAGLSLRTPTLALPPALTPLRSPRLPTRNVVLIWTRSQRLTPAIWVFLWLC